MKILVWLVRAALFFTLLAFALNNQHEASIKWLFGQEWRAPMVFIVLGAFAFGCVFGVFAMVPSWWQHRRAARRQRHLSDAVDTQVADTPLHTDSNLLRHEL
ncbi:MAG: lipopolysaccharide assembly protein LapA domain-containing protein [Rhizobacter sp.]